MVFGLTSFATVLLRSFGETFTCAAQVHSYVQTMPPRVTMAGSSLSQASILDRTGILNTPHEDTKLEFAHGESGATMLARLGFALPLLFTATLLSFVLYWGALLFPPFAVFFICAFISYGWFKGILYSFSALFIGIPLSHLYKTADWKQLANDNKKKSPLLERTLGVSEEDGRQ